MKTQNLMKASVLALLVAFGSSAAAQQTILIDFGTPPSWRGVETPSPDGNSNYWNCVSSYYFFPDLVDIDGNATSANFGFIVPGGTDSYNGPAGITSNPPTQAEIDLAAANIDAEALGNLGIAEAAMDFYTNSTFVIGGLDPNATYNLTFYGSHKYSPDMTTRYSVYTDDTFSSAAASVTLDVVAAPDGSPGADQHNQDTVVTISDVDPQPWNTLYIKFIGVTGADGYLNCMQIEEALPVKATNPNPSDGATNVPLTTNLSWTEPGAYTPVKYVLSFRTSPGDSPDPNVPDPNWIIVDPVLVPEAAVPMTLEYGTTYDWIITSFKAGDPNGFEGPIWSFTTEAELQVDAGPSILTWLDGGSANVDLNGAVIYPYTLSSVLWSVVEKPVASTVVIDDDSSPTTSASFDATGTYVLKLWAQDDGVPLENEDTMEVQVEMDACEAAKANPNGYIPLMHDSNDDCREDLQDLAQFAVDWLKDTSLTENLEY